MPTVSINDAEIHFEDSGGDKEVIVFIHGLMLASESYRAQREAFKAMYRVVTFDLRGQGKSEKTKTGLDLDSLALDTSELIRVLNLGQVHLVGFSMGSFVAMRVAARAPTLVRTLTLIGPSADAEEPGNIPRYRKLIQFVRWFGPRWIAPKLMRILFGDTFLQSQAAAPEREHWLRYVKRLPRELSRAAEASAKRAGMAHELANIKAPTLVISGEEDRPISPARAFQVHRRIAGSQFLAFKQTGHAVMIEQPEQFNRKLGAFLVSAEAPA